VNPDAKTFIDELEVVRKQAVEYAGFINRIRDRISRAEKALAEKPTVVSVLSSLVSDLQAMKSQSEQPPHWGSGGIDPSNPRVMLVGIR
jgi:hypothetical protein